MYKGPEAGGAECILGAVRWLVQLDFCVCVCVCVYVGLSQSFEGVHNVIEEFQAKE